eukprot:984789-Rhodomonas_salina.2
MPPQYQQQHQDTARRYSTGIRLRVADSRTETWTGSGLSGPGARLVRPRSLHARRQIARSSESAGVRESKRARVQEEEFRASPSKRTSERARGNRGEQDTGTAAPARKARARRACACSTPHMSTPHMHPLCRCRHAVPTTAGPHILEWSEHSECAGR